MCCGGRARLHVSREEFPDWDFTRYAEGIGRASKYSKNLVWKGTKKPVCGAERDGVDVRALQPSPLSRADEVWMC